MGNVQIPEIYIPGYDHLKQAVQHLRKIDASKLRSCLLLPLEIKYSQTGYQEQDEHLRLQKSILEFLKGNRKTLYDSNSSCYKLASAIGLVNLQSGNFSSGIALVSEISRFHCYEKKGEIESRIMQAYPLVNLVRLEGECTNNSSLISLADGSQHWLSAHDLRKNSPLYIPLEE